MISVFWDVRLLYLPFKDKHSPVYLDVSVKWSYTYADTTVCVCVCVDFININSFTDLSLAVKYTDDMNGIKSEIVEVLNY